MRWLILVCLLVGCADMENQAKHNESYWSGLNRTIKLYSNEGKVIKEWKTKAKVEDRGGTCWFLDSNKKAIIISGTFIIEEQ